MTLLSAVLLLTSSIDLVSAAEVLFGSAHKFKPVDKTYNENLQKYCANPQFLKDENPQHKIMHGVPVPKGTYPWAVVLNTIWNNGQKVTWCGGTLISSRHVITARHCFEGASPAFQVTLMVGGVCYAQGEKCDKQDMRAVEIEFAAYEPKVPQNGNETIKLFNHGHDIAIVQLKEELKHFDVNGQQNFTDTRPACLPQQEDKLPKELHVYGWGTTDKYKFGARHLMEVTLPVLDLENDPLAKTNEFKAGDYVRLCQHPKLFCMHSPEPGNKKDGAGGDSGSGIAGRKGYLAVLYGSTIAGTSEWQLNIGTRVQQQAYDICYYTGICTNKDWVGNIDPNRVEIKLSAFYVPQKQ